MCGKKSETLFCRDNINSSARQKMVLIYLPRIDLHLHQAPSVHARSDGDDIDHDFNHDDLAAQTPPG